MKKRLTLLLLTLITVFCIAFAACGEKQQDNTAHIDPDVVAITIPQDIQSGTSSGMFKSCSNKKNQQTVTLLEYMNELQEKGELSFVISNGMIQSINGKENSATENKYWMLYTNDAENANAAWGTYTYNDEVLSSATLGAETLVVKGGCLYVWAYQSF